MPNLLLIESPGKLKKLQQILGSGWIIRASMGHVRQLADDGMDALGFDLGDRSIDCRYVPRDARSKKVLAELRQAVKQADAVYIATDPDREGETIGWHLQQELRIKNARRVTYTEITAQAVQAAIAHPRQLDPNLVAAGRARDCLDKLVGYRGSKYIVWKLNNGAKSMGRVQSATLNIVCQRELEIQQFQPQDYWSVWVEYPYDSASGDCNTNGTAANRLTFKAFYRTKRAIDRTATANRPAARSDASDSKEPDTKESDRVTSQAEADRLVAIARSHPHQVVSVKGKIVHQSPPPPFTTSTLQQAAGSKLKLSPERTMKVAQSLYEAGHITYMRTDSVSLSEQFCAATRQYLEETDPQNVPQSTTRHRSTKTAQEAHEAIRPTEIRQIPDRLVLSGDEAALYDLIWHRSIASQCAPARLNKTQIITQSGDIRWEARGQVIEFLGYARYWNNLSNDSQLPIVQSEQILVLKQAGADQKQTQPPPRYTEPKLVQVMEQKGIGRPSTYAPTIKTLKERQYVEVVKGKLQATALGLDLNAALCQLVPDLVQPEFTAQMEAKLDAIATGKQDWQAYLIDWNQQYFEPALQQATQKIGTVIPIATTPLFAPTTAAETPSRSSARSTSRTSTRSSSSSGKTSTRKSSTRKSSTRNSSDRNSSDRNSSDRSTTTQSSTLQSSTLQSSTLQSSTRRPKVQDSGTPPSSDFTCPVCGAVLERHRYTKDGQTKEMLRCSIFEHRQGKCKEVAFFQARGEFWSPKFGTITPGDRASKP